MGIPNESRFDSIETRSKFFLGIPGKSVTIESGKMAVILGKHFSNYALNWVTIFPPPGDMARNAVSGLSFKIPNYL